MKIYVSKTLFIYCYKADNYYDYKRRVCLLTRYIQRKFDKRLIKCINNMFLWEGVIK